MYYGQATSLMVSMCRRGGEQGAVEVVFPTMVHSPPTPPQQQIRHQRFKQIDHHLLIGQ